MVDRLILDLPKNGRERLRVSVSEFRGSRFVDLRLFATGPEGDCRPSKQGVTLRPDQIAAVAAALAEAEQILTNTGSKP